MKVWVLLLENIEGGDEVELYSTYEKARAAFENYAKENEHKCGFGKSNYDMAWTEFGDHCERSCYISMYEEGVI